MISRDIDQIVAFLDIRGDVSRGLAQQRVGDSRDPVLGIVEATSGLGFLRDALVHVPSRLGVEVQMSCAWCWWSHRKVSVVRMILVWCTENGMDGRERPGLALQPPRVQ